MCTGFDWLRIQHGLGGETLAVSENATNFRKKEKKADTIFGPFYSKMKQHPPPQPNHTT